MQENKIIYKNKTLQEKYIKLQQFGLTLIILQNTLFVTYCVIKFDLFLFGKYIIG